jgi:general secretion pathway protein C
MPGKLQNMPRQIHILFNLLALSIITFIVVDTLYNLISIKLVEFGPSRVVSIRDVEVQRELPLTSPDYAMISERNIFGATEKVEQPPVEEKVAPVEMLEETSLQLSLLGTIAGDTESARAIILDQRTKSQGIYKVDDPVQEAVIKQILRGKVVLRHGDKDEVLTMAEDDTTKTSAKTAPVRNESGRRGRMASRVTPQAEVPTGEVEVENIQLEQQEVQNAMNDLNGLMTQVRVRPYFRAGRPEGLIVSQIQPDSIFSKMGFMNGDIIATVNGKQMSTPEEAFQLYNSLQSGSEVNIEITRRGQKRMLSYQIQ